MAVSRPWRNGWPHGRVDGGSGHALSKRLGVLSAVRDFASPAAFPSGGWVVVLGFVLVLKTALILHSEDPRGTIDAPRGSFRT